MMAMAAGWKQSHRGWHAIGALLIGIAIFAFHLPWVQDNILFADSADYARSAEAPALGTWLNTNSASPLEMLRLRRTNPEFKQKPWDYLYATGDNAALRHFHGPVGYYAMRWVYAAFGTDSAQRKLSSAAGAAVCGFLFYLLAQFGVAVGLAALLALFAGVQSTFVEVNMEPLAHGWFMLFALVFLYLLARYLTGRQRRDLFGAAVALGVAMATLEFTVELVASIPLALALVWFADRQSLPPWKDAKGAVVRAVGVLLLTTFVVWPGGWLRGGYLESYGVLSATVLLKNKTAFGDHLTAGVVYNAVFAHHVVTLLAAVGWVGGALWLLVRRRISVASLVFSSYTLFAFALGLADHFRLDTYVSEFTIFLIASAGLVGADLVATLHRTGLRRVAGGVVAVALLLGGLQEMRQHPDGLLEPWLAPVFAGIRQQVPKGEAVLVTRDRESLEMHLPEYRFEPTVTATSAEPRTPSRAAGVRYGLFDSTVPMPAGAQVIAVYPKAAGNMVLWGMR